MTIIAIVEEAFFEAQAKKGLGPLEYGRKNDDSGGGGGDDDDERNYLPPTTEEEKRSQSVESEGLVRMSSGTSVGSTATTSSSTLRRQSSWRPEDTTGSAGGGGSGKRELPENVKALLRNVNRIPSLTGQQAASGSDWLNAAYGSGIANPIQTTHLSLARTSTLTGGTGNESKSPSTPPPPAADNATHTNT